MIGVYIHHIWLCLSIIKLSGEIEKNAGLKRNSSQLFSICHWNLNSIIPQISNYSFWELIFHSIILMYFVYQTHILTLPQHLMIKILKFMDITYYGLIMHLIVRVVVFVYIIKVHCFEIYWCLLFTRMLSFCNFNSWGII